MRNITIYRKDRPLHDSNKIISPSGQARKFEDLLEKAHNVLFRASSVFPFDFFPDEITIDENKVNIIFRQFYLSEDIHSITLDMIRDIEVESGPFFASIRIVPDGFPGNSIIVKFLKKKDAIKARRIIQGLMLAARQGVDLLKLNSKNLIKDIEFLGSTHLADL